MPVSKESHYSYSNNMKDLIESILISYVPFRLENELTSGNEINQYFKSLANTLKRSAAVEIHKTILILWGTGKGAWAEVPWIAFLDSRLSARIVSGVYCAFLFRADMSGFYLTLTQGTDESSRARRGENIGEIRSQLNLLLDRHSDLRHLNFKFDREIDLRSRLSRPRAYERATLIHKFYGVNAVPKNEDLLQDLAALLALYEDFVSSSLQTQPVESDGELPVSEPPETIEREEIPEGEEIFDDATTDDTVTPTQYDISSYGADFDVEGLVRRLQRRDIFVPTFQREYVWSQQEASRFIESLLLGLPVPGVFLARETESNRLYVIDGQQRLKTLQFFYDGVFKPNPNGQPEREFRLIKVQSKFLESTYATLSENDRLKLDDSIIHATIIKQESPKDNDTSVYHVFERLNTGGRKLFPQEIRTAIFHGPLIDLVRDLNEYDNWRDIFGKRNERLKDQELILRFLALYFDGENYERPMNEFINRFTKLHRNDTGALIDDSKRVFRNSVDVILKSIGNRAFRPQRSINAAVFDSVMVGLTRRLEAGSEVNLNLIKPIYERLLLESDYTNSVMQSTSDPVSVRTRLTLATQRFADA